MRAVVQRVTHARVEVDGTVSGEIGAGLLILLGVSKTDQQADSRFLSEKVLNLRIFADAEGKMNRSLLETGGALLVVSQFTLYGDCRKGRRPGLRDLGYAGRVGAGAVRATSLQEARRTGVRVETGVFQTHMTVSLTNDGPVTLIIDSPQQ